METVKFRTRIGLATPKENMEGWDKGEKKKVCVAKMSTGRVCIYKDLKHHMEPSGYTTYNSIDELKGDFYTELIQERVVN